MNKVITSEQTAEFLYNGMVVMIGGFLDVGSPEMMILAMIDRNVRDVTLIANDTAYADKGIGRLIANRQVKKAIVSHIGTNPETGRQMMDNDLDVELVPQGTLAERIRCGGAGLGGVLTRTGIGTVVETGKQKMLVGGQEYLLETPLRASVALIRAKKADKAGNLIYEKAARNFNPLMAAAADLVIAEVDELVETGVIDADEVMTPGILVDKILYRGGAFL
ncbi:acetate CoA-transferase subunit alpha [Sporomusa aerivorans]|uniref:acetate CoA-transferase subunit alpha n=1 Tax=Sporomusa aerivorans TaxID=204936 RepID=UPI00352ABD3D